MVSLAGRVPDQLATKPLEDRLTEPETVPLEDPETTKVELETVELDKASENVILMPTIVS